MKLIKLSFAAIIAAGAMTTFASATPLEDAIKGVEVSGMARYRFYHQSDRGIGYGDNQTQRNRFSGELNIASPIADNLKFGISLTTDANNFASNDASSTDGVNVDKFWFQYAINDLTIKAGKMEIPTPWTESAFAGTRGNGILALYSGVENWTFAAAYYNQVNGIWDNHGVIDESIFGQEDLMAAAIIGSYDIFGAQLWASRMTNVFDYSVFAQVNVNLSGFNALAQMNYLRLADELKGTFDDDSGIFMGFTAGYKNDNFFVEAGYTKTDRDMGIYSLTPDDDSFIKFGQQLYYLTHNYEDQAVYFLRGGFNYNKFGFEAGFGFNDDGIDSDEDLKEYYGSVSYQCSKNFSLQAYYSFLDAKKVAEDYLENKEFRFQALYTF